MCWGTMYQYCIYFIVSIHYLEEFYFGHCVKQCLTHFLELRCDNILIVFLYKACFLACKNDTAYNVMKNPNNVLIFKKTLHILKVGLKLEFSIEKSVHYFYEITFFTCHNCCKGFKQYLFLKKDNIYFMKF